MRLYLCVHAWPDAGCCCGAGLDSLGQAASWPNELIKMPAELAVSDAGIAALARTLPDMLPDPPVQQAPLSPGRHEPLTSQHTPPPPSPTPSPQRGGWQGGAETPHAGPGTQQPWQQQQSPPGEVASTSGMPAVKESPAVQQMSALHLYSPVKPGSAPTFSLQVYATSLAPL